MFDWQEKDSVNRQLQSEEKQFGLAQICLSDKIGVTSS